MSSNPELSAITEEFSETYDYYMTEHAGPSYVATWIIKEAIEIAGSADPVAVRDAIASKDWSEGYAAMNQPGVISWNDDGYNVKSEAIIIQWQDGLPRTIYPREYSNTEIMIPGIDY